MNSISSKFPRALLDTTVLCGALRTNGLNRQLLLWARSSEYYQPIISKVCLFEMYNVALTRGLQKVTYTAEDLDSYMDDVIYPVLEQNQAVNSTLGRFSYLVRLYANRPIGEVLVELTGSTSTEVEQIIKTEGMEEPLHKYDPEDAHIWVTAIQERCDYIVTSNTHRFPERIGNIKRIHPRDFLYHVLKVE